jgi:hypothetical protein
MNTIIEIPRSKLSTVTLLIDETFYNKGSDNILYMINNSKYLVMIFSLLSIFTIFLSNSYLFVILANFCFSFYGYYSLKKYRRIDFNLFFCFLSISNFISYVSQIVMLSNFSYDLVTIFITIIFMVIQLWILFYFCFLFLEFSRYTDDELELLKN